MKQEPLRTQAISKLQQTDNMLRHYADFVSACGMEDERLVEVMKVLDVVNKELSSYEPAVNTRHV